MKWRHYCSLVLILLLSACARWQPMGLEGRLVSTNAALALPDTSLVRALIPYKQRVDSNMNITLVENALLMKKEQPESALGNMMADVMLEFAKEADLQPDLAITNHGGIRVSLLEKGILTYRDAFQLMPFENRIVMLELPGDVLLQWFGHMASKGGWPVANASYRISPQRAVLTPIYIGDGQLDTSASYRVVTTDYLATGGDYCDFLKGIPFIDTGYLLRDAIIDHWKALGERGEMLKVEKEGRVAYGE